MRIDQEEMRAVFQDKLIKNGVPMDKAHKAADIIVQNSLYGVYSHGVNRFSKIIEYIQKGYIDVNADVECEVKQDVFERWNGHRGFGFLNASAAMEKACTIAKEFGMGVVAIRNNNHWLRGGMYGLMAANQNCIGICWSNSKPNMPTWQGNQPKIGNNPLVMAVPGQNGKHLLLDIAMSQYSYGKIEEYRLKKQILPFDGGFDTFNDLTKDPDEIYKTKKILPIGLWKGSGLSILLDVIGAILSNGYLVQDIGQFEQEIGLTQIMISINPEKMLSLNRVCEIVNEVTHNLKANENEALVLYPGEKEYETYVQNLKDGIPVLDSVWNKIIHL